jgi:hypothetical protein
MWQKGTAFLPCCGFGGGVGMTPKRMVVLNLKEIAAIDIHCQCGGIASLTLDAKLRPDFCCPNCTEQLWSEGEIIQEAMRNLVKSLNEIKERAKEFSVTFSIEDQTK